MNQTDPGTDRRCLRDGKAALAAARPDPAVCLSGARVLVTGGLGFIGSYLVRHLIDGGSRVTILDDLSTSRSTGEELGPDVDLVRANVLDPELYATRTQGFDLVFHLAGVVGMRLATKDRSYAYRVAAEGTRSMLAATGAAPVVLFSSSAVYGTSNSERPMDEDDAVTLKTALKCDGGSAGYATGKLEMERLAHAECKDGRRVVVVRPFNVIGPGQTGRYGMVVPSFVRAAINHEPLRVYDDGLQTRSFSYVDRFVHYLMELVTSAGAWNPGANTFNLGSTDNVSIKELAELVLAVTGSRSHLEFVRFDVAFPGCHDVRGRTPNVARVERLIGERLSWPSLGWVVERVAEFEQRQRFEVRPQRPSPDHRIPQRTGSALGMGLSGRPKST